MEIFICNLVILFMALLGSVQSIVIVPEIPAGETDLSRFHEGQVVHIAGNEDYDIVENGNPREMDVIEHNIVKWHNELPRQKSEILCIPKIVPRLGYMLMRKAISSTKRHTHIATADATGIFYTLSGRPVVQNPMNTDLMLDTNHNPVGLYMLKKWRPYIMVPFLH